MSASLSSEHAPPTWEGVVIRLPMPPSANRLVMPHPRQRRLIATPEARAFRREAVDAIRRAAGTTKRRPLGGAVRFEIVVYVKTISSDGPNREKAVEDALTEAGVWADDCCVVSWQGEKRLAKLRVDRPGETGVSVRVFRAQAKGFGAIHRQLLRSKRGGASEVDFESMAKPAYEAPPSDFDADDYNGRPRK